MAPGFGGFPLFFLIAFGVVAMLVLAVVVLVVVSATRSRRVLRESGLDPLAAPAQIAARLAHGPLSTPATRLEQRLTELDDVAPPWVDHRCRARRRTERSLGADR